MSSVLALKKKLRYMVPEIRLALIKEGGVKAKGIRRPDDMEQFVEPLKFFSEEHFISFHVDAKNAIIGYHDISHGTLNASLVHPREVFKAALLTNAYGIIVAHNHPAGSLDPSREDLETTTQLIKAGALLGVNVIDHLIVSSNGMRSLRERYPELWDKSV